MRYDKNQTKVTEAVQAFEKMNCAQAVFSTFASEFRIDRKNALKIAFGFGGGVGRQGELCGAISGAIMTIGLKYGKLSSFQTDPREIVYGKVQEFCRRFEAIHQTTLCKNLIKFDMKNPEEHQKAIEAGVFTSLCPQFVKTAAEILVQMEAEDNAEND